MSQFVKKFLHEISKAEDDEESDLFLLRLHLNNQLDFGFFTEAEEEKVKKLLTTLIQDTLKHQQLLGKIQEELEPKKG